MKKYCFDTSGFSYAHEKMPEDIHKSMWDKLSDMVVAGEFAVNAEIYKEMLSITGAFGQCIKDHKDAMVLEVGDASWDYATYVAHNNAMNVTHHAFISEYNGGSPKTVCINDVSVVALAKTLNLPLVSGEVTAGPSPKKRKIPDVCKLEGVTHFDINDFLRAASIKL